MAHLLNNYLVGSLCLFQSAISCYKSSLERLQFSGPTKIKKIIAMAESLAVKPATQDNQLYHVLLIITVSEFTNWNVAIISGIYLTKIDQKQSKLYYWIIQVKAISYGSLRQ